VTPQTAEVLESCAFEPVPVDAMAVRLALSRQDVVSAMSALQALRLACISGDICRATPSGVQHVREGRTRGLEDDRRPLSQAKPGRPIGTWLRARNELDRLGWFGLHDSAGYVAVCGSRTVQADSPEGLLRAVREEGRGP